MEIRNWNKLHETIEIQKNYIPLNIRFGDEVEYPELLHYRIINNNTVIEFHFEKKTCALKYFIIVNIDEQTKPVVKDIALSDRQYSTMELRSLYCNEKEWENKENVSHGNFISDETRIEIENYQNGFKINFIHSDVNAKDRIHYKLSEKFILSISLNKISSVTILDFDDFQKLFE